EAYGILGTADLLDGLDATTGAAKSGLMAPRKLAAVAAGANADPDAEGELLKLAETASVKDVQERSRQVQRDASSETDEQRAARAHRRRRLWHRIDENNGDSVGGWRLPAPVGAELVAELNRIANGIFESARTSGVCEDHAAYLADALTAMARSSATPRPAA